MSLGEIIKSLRDVALVLDTVMSEEDYNYIDEAITEIISSLEGEIK